MQKIYLIKQQESASKVAVLYNMNVHQIKQGSRKIEGHNFYALSGYDDGIYIIENYNQPFILRVQNQTKEQLTALGYEISQNEINKDDVVLLSLKNGKRHIVRPLEKLQEIANRYSVSINDIIKQNNLKTEKLYIGQILWV